MTSRDLRDFSALRLLRPAPYPLGLYLRVARNDHAENPSSTRDAPAALMHDRSPVSGSQPNPRPA